MPGPPRTAGTAAWQRDQQTGIRSGAAARAVPSVARHFPRGRSRRPAPRDRPVARRGGRREGEGPSGSRGARGKLWVAVAAAVFFSASGFSATVAGLADYAPGSLALLRFLVASVLLALYAALSGMRLPHVRDFPALALAGFLGFSVFTVLLAYGQLSVTVGTASLLIATIPAFTALGAMAFLRERLGAVGWVGVAVSFL
jgi:hypothetical protein